MIDRGDGVRLACRHQPGGGQTLVFLPGYMSDMDGTKAQALSRHAARRGRGCLRLDYSGCGRSEGDFAAGSVRRWAADAAAAIAALAPDGPLLLVGSSMGGWIMLHLALALPHRVSGLVGVAAAPDFTRWGLSLDAADRAMLELSGRVERQSPWGEQPYSYSAGFLLDAEGAALLDRPIAIDCPVRLLHGLDDGEVPWEVSLRLSAALAAGDVRTILVKGGDHRLSRPADLQLLFQTVEELS